MRPLARNFFLCALLLAGCGLQTDKPAPLQKDMSYRALGNYCWEEIARMKEQRIGVTKVVRVNGQTDSLMVKDSAGLQALFKPLMDADVSKPSLADAYQVDTIADQFHRDTTFIYHTKGKQTWPAQLILDVDSAGRIKTAQVSSYTKNLVYEYRQEVLYERNKQLRVSTFQKIIFLKPESLEVLAWFHPTTNNS
ncbi:hypothetical protein ACFOTA_10630 [Chitinophaga sp. GCM10012297]|uniref:Lipoprotein n=1 Tax=Chitinophaga chungangae TaxID=2821488 RepID=A0ABS3YED8_9BACT|nr:hypothetical protein [Chitinophaga chungangae]MBO9152663.1 hypothetical protein [Chitinophaga chungangae]